MLMFSPARPRSSQQALASFVIGLSVLSLLPLAVLASPSLERGAYLVQGPMACGNCHTPMGPQGPVMEQDLAGRLVEKNDAFTAIAPNITPAGRIADWSDADLGRAIREGIRPDGSLIGPPMPFTMYRGLGDDDLASVVMYLRSVPPVENDPGQSEYQIALPPAYGPPVADVTPPARDASAEYGAYLAGPVAHCLECHTPLGPRGPMVETDLGRGGFVFETPMGRSVAANLTSHEDGLAGYTDAQIAAMITEGRAADGSAMAPPMPYAYFARMTEEDVTALILYLRTLPPLPDAK